MYAVTSIPVIHIGDTLSRRSLNTRRYIHSNEQFSNILTKLKDMCKANRVTEVNFAVYLLETDFKKNIEIALTNEGLDIQQSHSESYSILVNNEHFQ